MARLEQSRASLAHCSGGLGVVGLNPAAPTIKPFENKGFSLTAAPVAATLLAGRKRTKRHRGAPKHPQNHPHPIREGFCNLALSVRLAILLPNDETGSVDTRDLDTKICP
jgi:hypothetical protein